MQQTNTLFATDINLNIDTTTLGKLVLTCVIIFLAYFFIKNAMS